MGDARLTHLHARQFVHSPFLSLFPPFHLRYSSLLRRLRSFRLCSSPDLSPSYHLTIFCFLSFSLSFLAHTSFQRVVPHAPERGMHFLYLATSCTSWGEWQRSEGRGEGGGRGEGETRGGRRTGAWLNL